MEIGCPNQARRMEVLFQRVTGRSLDVRRKSSYTIIEVLNIIRYLGLDKIKMVPPGVIKPWRLGCRIAYFGGDVLRAMENLPAEDRHFYHKIIFF